MARCPDCNRFTANDSTDPEVQSEHIGEGNAEIEVRICRVCAECGTELKEYTFSFDIDLPQEAIDHECEKGEADIVVTTTAENTERTDGAGRRAPTFYGVEINCEFSCATCDAQFDGATRKDEVQASSMDEC